MSEEIPVERPLEKVVLSNGADDVEERKGETVRVGSVVLFRKGVVIGAREELRDEFPGDVGNPELLGELLLDSASVALVPEIGAESDVDDTGRIVKLPGTLVFGTVEFAGCVEEAEEIGPVEVDSMEDAFDGIDGVEVPLSVPDGDHVLTYSVEVNRLDVFEGEAVVNDPRNVLVDVGLGKRIVGKVSRGAELVFTGKGAEVGRLSNMDEELEVRLEPYASAEEVAKNDVKLTSCVASNRYQHHCIISNMTEHLPVTVSVT